MTDDNGQMLDNGKVKIGAALSIAGIVLAVQAAAFHQVLQIRESIAEIKADQRVNSKTMERLELDVAKLREGSADWLRTSDLAIHVDDIMLRSGYIRRADLPAEIKNFAPYNDERAMILQRLEKLEKALSGGD